MQQAREVIGVQLETWVLLEQLALVDRVVRLVRKEFRAYKVQILI